ncbi:MAG: hypothetical protein GXY50_08445 [Syntrophomonadaceae bacterium]|nr:hypothetical protein [Syntrophomonadaceae bacterium]
MGVKSRRILGLPVIQEGAGNVLGRVADVVIDDGFQVKSLLVDVREGRCVLDMDEVVIGHDVLLVKGAESLKRVEAGQYCIKGRERTGMMVLDYDGRELGIMSDVVVEPESKEVQGIEISSGIIKDFITGRSEISLENVIGTDGDTIIIQNEEE